MGAFRGKGRSRLTLLLVSGLAILAVSGCGGSAQPSAQGNAGGAAATEPEAESILIGFSAPLTGAAAQEGIDFMRGAELAAEEINAAGGILGRKIEFRPEDDACDPQTGAAVAQKFITDKVTVAAGYYCSGVALAAEPLLNRENVPTLLGAISNTDATAQGFKNVFRVNGGNKHQSREAVRVMVEELKSDKVVLIHDNSAYAKDLIQLTESLLKEQHPQVAVSVEAITPGEKDFSAVLTRIKQQDPDAIYVGSLQAEGSAITVQAKNMGLRAKLVLSDGNNGPAYLEMAGDKAEGVIITSPPFAEFLPEAKAFAENYTKKYGTGPSGWSVYAYDEIYLATDAIKRAGGTDRQKVVDALRSTKDLKRLTSTMTFDENGDLVEGGFMSLVVQNGKFQQLGK